MSKGSDALDRTFHRWKWNPVAFSREALGFTPSNQQEQGLNAVRDLVRAKLKRSQGEELRGRELELSKKIGISIASGHNTGKDRFLSAVYLWWLVCFPRAKGLVTGPNMSTIKSVLWHEFRKNIRKSAFLNEKPGWLQPMFEIQSDKLILKDSGGEAFIEARTANVRGSADEQGEALAGRHEQYLLLSVDEASGVPDGVFKPIEGALAGRVNFAILIGNMTRRTGYFYSTHYDHPEFWVCQRWDTEESNLDAISGGDTNCAGLVQFYEKKYGRDTNPFRVRIQGLPPSADMDAFIPWEWIERAVGRDITASDTDPVVYGVDPAYAGKDRTALCKRHGHRVTSVHDVRHLDPTDVAKWVMDHYAKDKADERQPDVIAVDTIGVGAGVESTLRHAGYRTMSVVVSESAHQKELYGNRRNELWHIVRTQFEKGIISIPDNRDLIDELASIKCHPPQQGIIRVMSKAEWRKEKGGDIEASSPDLADALCMTYAVGESYRSYGHGGYEDDWVEKNPYRPLNSLVGY